MRWCILPAHTHSQIRLDLHELNAKSADPRAPERARGRGKIGILAKEQIQCTTATETNANRTPSQDERRAARVARPDDTNQSKVALVHERATPRAQTFFNTRARDVLTHTYTRYNSTLFYTQKHTCLHYNYTRYGYVKPINFVNCPKKDF